MDRLRHRGRLLSLEHSTIEACFSVPMLNLTLPSVASVGELLLTPRGLFALGQRSLRTVRRQVKALKDVGEEIVHGGREVLGRSEEKPGDGS